MLLTYQNVVTHQIHPEYVLKSLSFIKVYIECVDKTGPEINHSFLFHGVIKILTVCGMLRISIARCQIEAEIHSFPTMYIMGGVDMFEMGQIDDFVPKIGPKSCFFRDTNLVLPTLGGSGTPKF